MVNVNVNEGITANNKGGVGGKVSLEGFMKLYDKNVGNKIKLKDLWNEISEKDKIKIMAYVPKYKIAFPSKQYRKNPDKFLIDHTWNDELIFPATNKKLPVTNAITPQRRLELLLREVQYNKRIPYTIQYARDIYSILPDEYKQIALHSDKHEAIKSYLRVKVKGAKE